MNALPLTHQNPANTKFLSRHVNLRTPTAAGHENLLPPSSPLNSPAILRTGISTATPASDRNTGGEFETRLQGRRRGRIRGVWYLFDMYMSL